MEFIDSNTGGGVILAIDGTIETELGPIRSFKLSSEMPLSQEEIRERTAKYAMQMHYYAWQQQNPGRTETFEQYLDLVANGGGQYSIQASKEGVNPNNATLEDIVDNDGIIGDRINSFKTVSVDPSKPVVIIATHGSNQYNPARSASQTYWPIVTSDGQVYFRIKIIDVDYTRGEIDATKEFFGLTMLRIINSYGVWSSSKPTDLSISDGKEVWLEISPEQKEYGNWFQPNSLEDGIENKAFIIGEIGEISE